jgi:hypothetical protein
MSSQLAKGLVLPSNASGRSGDGVSMLFGKLSGVACKVWVALEKVGQARADREMAWLAVRHAHNPELAQALRNAMHRGDRG